MPLASRPIAQPTSQGQWSARKTLECCRGRRIDRWAGCSACWTSGGSPGEQGGLD